MKIEFFKAHREHKDSRKDSKSKIWFGFFFIACGFMIIFAEYTGIDRVSSGGMSTFGKMFSQLMTLLYVSLGRWISSMIFYIIGIIFIIWGFHDSQKEKINAS